MCSRICSPGMMPIDPDSLARVIADQADQRRPPVHLWNPPVVQDIGIRIGRDGTWYYQNSPITRPAMVRLFASVLRRDEDEFFLVTPVEKVRVRVDLAPFIAVAIEVIDEAGGPALAFRTNVGDAAVVDDEHPLGVEQEARGPLPFVRVRDRLDALLSRSVFYELAAGAATAWRDGEEVLGVASRGRFWVLGSTSE